MTDDPDFFAWLDDELPDAEAAAMADRVSAEPALRAMADEHRRLGHRISAAFAPIAAAPVPAKLAELARPSAEVIDLAAARERRRRWSVVGLAAAASLALGLGIGISVPRAGNGNFTSHGTQLAAAGPLAGALDRQLASAGDQSGIRIGLSFKDHGGRFCRSFTAGARSGLACHVGDGWTIEGLIAGPVTAGDYRMAAGPDPAIGALIDQRIAGEALDAEGERKLIRSGWKG